jgi:hypothetical protein
MLRLLAALTLCVPMAAQVAFMRHGDQIEVRINGRPFTTLHFDAVNNKPYLHPLLSASGKAITRHYPFENVAGEDTEHPHHRGVSLTHGDVNGLDFWASEPSQRSPKQGRILLDKVEQITPGATSGEINTVFRWLDPAGKPVLLEHRKMTFRAHLTLRIIDFDITLRPASGPVRFGDTKEGFFSVRLGTGLSEDGGGLIVSSNGASTETQVWGTRADWVDDSGKVDGEKLGIAVFDHPANPRHPTYWHSRAYGLIAANIFGWHDFLQDKSKDGALVLPAGESLRFRYRIVIHPGDARSAGIARLYSEYSSTGPVK